MIHLIYNTLVETTPTTAGDPELGKLVAEGLRP